MDRIKIGFIALLATLGLGACSVQGVSEYQNALYMGCTPSAGGGVSC